MKHAAGRKKMLRLLALALSLVLLAAPVSAVERLEPELPTGETVLRETAAPETEVPEIEPAATEAPATEPAETDPATTEPVTTEPTEPVTTEPTEPVTTEPTEPVTTEPTEPEPTEPPEPEKPLEEMTDEELIEKFAIPDTWARRALIFAARYGLLKGKGGVGLAPGDLSSRAEVATICVRILQTETEKDLSGFTDVEPGAWYYSYLAKAYALGIFQGGGDGTMNPGSNITREQTFVVLSRIFGLGSGEPQTLYRFSDWRDVSGWAAGGMAAMVEHGFVQGSGGSLNPKGLITRAELAQVFCNVFDRIGTSLEPLDNRFTGSFGLAADSLAPQTEITGDLLLCNEVAQLSLEGVTVTGRLVIQGNGPLTLSLNNCSIGELVLCRPTTLSIQGGSVNTLSVLSPSTLSAGHVETLYAWADVALGAEASVGSLGLRGDGVHCVVDGQVDTMTVTGKNCSLEGSGSVEHLSILAEGFQGSCATVGTREENLDPGIANIHATRTDKGAADAVSPVLTLGLKLTNMPAGQRDCTVTWTIEGSVIHTERLLLTEGSRIFAQADLSSYILRGFNSVSVTVTITSEGKSFVYEGAVVLAGDVATAAQLVRTQEIQAVITENAPIYRYYNVYSQTFAVELGEVEEGTQVTIVKTSKVGETRDNDTVEIILPDGRDVWTYYSAIRIIDGTYFTTQDYSTEVKEFFVNHIRSRSSDTQYLIWVSLWTQRINIFQGYEGHWKLIRTGPCATGRNDCPSPVETVKVRWTSPQWKYASFYVHHVTLFDESRAFHSRPTRYDDGGIYDYAMGYPCSNGCIRLLDEDCIWIYDNIPADTTVMLY